MNNTDFKRFVLDTPRQSQDAASNSFAKPNAPASSLGSRSKSSIPMTPRTVKGSHSLNFAQQLAEQNAASQPAKKFRASAAPKGVKLSEGYTDRTRDRDGREAENDGREARIQALEEQMKLGQIDNATFEQLRDTITGGDIGATHLVKGLDRRLLERIRKGEDVLVKKRSEEEPDGLEKSPDPDAEDEFDKLEQRELAPVEHGKAEKKGAMAPPPKPVAGVKRSRNDILAELKASRKAAEEAKAASQPQLGTRFRRLGQQKQTEPRIERDERGREVLITVDENGRVKRKVKKVTEKEKETQTEKSNPSGLLMLDKSAAPLGMAVPESTPSAADKKDEKSESDDIFEGVDDSYDPLGAGAADEESEDSSEDGEVNVERETQGTAPPDRPTATQPSASDIQPTKRNYFNDAPSKLEDPSTKGLDDPAIIETLKRAAALRAQEAAADSHLPGSNAAADAHEPIAPSSAAAKRLLQRDRDLDDIDMGFGSSRFEDEDEDDDGGGRIKLSKWKGGLGGEENDDGDEKARGGGKQRKRGKKKKKGDKDSAADVLRVMEGRKK